MEFVVPMLLFMSHVVTFILGYSLGSHVWSFHRRDR